jgi:hypothetical protein
MWAIDGGYHHRDSFMFPSHANASSSAGLCRLKRHGAPSGPRFALMRNTRAARNAAASDASDATMKITFLSVLMTFSQWSRYCVWEARLRMRREKCAGQEISEIDNRVRNFCAGSTLSQCLCDNAEGAFSDTERQ